MNKKGGKKEKGDEKEKGPEKTFSKEGKASGNTYYFPKPGTPHEPGCKKKAGPCNKTAVSVMLRARREAAKQGEKN